VFPLEQIAERPQRLRQVDHLAAFLDRAQPHELVAAAQFGVQGQVHRVRQIILVGRRRRVSITDASGRM